MKKRLKIILSIIIILIVILFVLYKVNSMNKTEKEIINMTTVLMENISNEDYDKIKTYLKHTDGTELSDQEVANFILNTGLYRAILIENGTFSYDANTSFFNTNQGQVLFSFTALNGEKISSQLEYVNGYLTTDETQEVTKEMEKYPIDVDLADGSNIEYDEN